MGLPRRAPWPGVRSSARLVSEAGGLRCRPADRAARRAASAAGMCQRWVHVDPDIDLVDVVPPDFDDPGWIAVLEAEDHRDRPVLLVHADDDRLRDMALLDVVINNADRKGGHVLVEPEPHGRVWGCDHGVCFHEELQAAHRAVGLGRTNRCATATRRCCASSRAVPTGLGRRAGAAPEPGRGRRHALPDRPACSAQGRMPTPGDRWPVIPWPAF